MIGSGTARDAFKTFIPISVDTKARAQIITDFFDLLAAIAAHGKTNGLGGLKLSRFAGWWAFGHIDTGKGFDAGYKSWEGAADATSHLFFAFLRSGSPEPGKTNGILSLPRSLQQLVDSVDYPPPKSVVSNDTTKVVMIVDVVSPTPYALLRRAKNFEYRDSDRALQEFASYDDPVQTLTDECRRVLSAISSANQSNVSNAKTSTSLADPSWSRFEDIGFGSTIDEADEDDTLFGHKPKKPTQSLSPQSKGQYEDLARPTTPSWADFLSSGFVDENGNKAPAPILLPPDKILPPLSNVPRGQSSQSHRRNLDLQPNLDPGELASIASVPVDDAFWWVWISSLAGEEPTSRKAVFGRCALIETVLPDERWMVMEEQVKGAAVEPAVGTYIAEKKKSFFGFTTRRGKLTRRRSGIKKDIVETNGYDNHRATLAPDQQARIQQVAAELSKKKAAEVEAARRREANKENVPASNRNSVFTLGPMMKDDISPAMQWAKQYDKKEIRSKYLGDSLAGKGSKELLTLPSDGYLNRSTSTLSSMGKENKKLPAPPKEASRTNLPIDITPEPTAAAPEPPVTIIEPAPAPPEPQAAAPPVPEEPPVEARETPLPPALPTAPEPKKPGSSGSPNKLRKSTDGGRRSPEERRNRKPLMGPPPVQKTSGIRRLFGTKRSKSREPEPGTANPPDSPIEVNPAILAARRALEGKPVARSGTDSPPLSPSHFQKIKGAKSPIAAVQTVPQAPTPARPAPPRSNRAMTPEPKAPRSTDQDLHPAPPRTRHDDEYDQLSRVDTNEREHADREFSTFDQGPLEDQPAFAPTDSPSRAYTPEQEDPKFRQNHQSVYSAVTVPAEDSEPEEEEITKQQSPQDRWAQIRRNAADRAARQSEEQTTRSRTETRTDDGETSGEESK